MIKLKGVDIWKSCPCQITPGGDPAWRCPKCGGDLHVMGIETRYRKHNICAACGCFLLYPHEYEEAVNECKRSGRGYGVLWVRIDEQDPGLVMEIPWEVADD